MIGKWIKESREVAGLSQTDLAELMGTTRQNISHYENGRRESPSLEVLKEFSRILDLKIMIEKGEVIKMSKEFKVTQSIHDLRNQLAQHFKVVDTLTVQEFLNQAINIAELEFKLEIPTWRSFLPEHDLEWPDLAAEPAWDYILQQRDWGRFEFDFEIEKMEVSLSFSFDFLQPIEFCKLIKSTMPQDVLEVTNYPIDDV